MNKDLIENWNLRNENYDKNVLLATILNKGASFGTLYPDPFMFKYMSDAWFAKHKRTFEKWFEAFDIPYSPLENYSRFDQMSTKTKEDTLKYDRFKEHSDTDATHIGDSFSNEDLNDRTTENLTSQEVVDDDTTKHLTSQEVTDIDTTEHLTSQEVTDEDTTGSKTIDTDTTGHKEYEENIAETKVTDEDTTENTTIDITKKQDDISIITETPNNRSSETRVSAYNESDYQPSSMVIETGSTTTSHSKPSGSDYNIKDTEDNDKDVTGTKDVTETDTIRKTGEEDTTGTVDTTENTTGTLDKTVDFESNKTGTEDKTVNFESNESGTDDKTTDFESSKIGTDVKNTKTTSIDKYIDNNTSYSHGDSQSTTNNDRVHEETNYTHGNIGVTTGQQMLTQEVIVQGFTIYDQMAELFCDEMCIRIYLSPRQRGGCWCDY